LKMERKRKNLLQQIGSDKSLKDFLQIQLKRFGAVRFCLLDIPSKYKIFLNEAKFD
jgi:hypothetical protein